jgi:hypothetical protein
MHVKETKIGFFFILRCSWELIAIHIGRVNEAKLLLLNGCFRKKNCCFDDVSIVSMEESMFHLEQLFEGLCWSNQWISLSFYQARNLWLIPPLLQNFRCFFNSLSRRLAPSPHDSVIKFYFKVEVHVRAEWKRQYWQIDRDRAVLRGCS